MDNHHNSIGALGLGIRFCRSEPAQLARYAFTLAQSFNNFYHQHHILKEENPERKVFLLWMTQFFLKELTAVLDVMGIEAPQVM